MEDLFSAAETNDGPGAAAVDAAPGAAPAAGAGLSEEQLQVIADAVAERIDVDDATAHLTPDFKPVRRNLKAPTKGGAPTLLQRILKTQLEVGPVSKENTNAEFRYKYSSVDDVVKATREALARNGVFVQITPARKRSAVVDFRNSKGRSVEAFSTITVLQADDPEEFIEYEISGLVQASGDKQEWVLSAQFRKYALIELLNLERGSADDHEAQKGGELVQGNAGPLSGSGRSGSYQRSAASAPARSSSAAPANGSDRQPARPEIGGDTTTREMMIRALQQGAPKAGGKPISEAQAKRLFAVAKDAGYTREQVVDSLGGWFRLTPADLPWQLYDGVVQLFAKYPTSQRETPPAPPENEADLDVE